MALRDSDSLSYSFETQVHNNNIIVLVELVLASLTPVRPREQGSSQASTICSLHHGILHLRPRLVFFQPRLDSLPPAHILPRLQRPTLCPVRARSLPLPQPPVRVGWNCTASGAARCRYGRGLVYSVDNEVELLAVADFSGSARVFSFHGVLDHGAIQYEEGED